jgi:peptide/nickel transport system ATP-binding protein/oligopeptide transport system ATP-binding protein
MSEPILAAEHITKRFRKDAGLFARGETVIALDDVSVTLGAGETLALVGESGSGKSTLARVLMQIVRADGGRVLFRGADVARLNRKDRMLFRRSVQMVFQDPFGSLNPRLSVGRIIAEPLAIHGIGDRKERQRRVAEALESVGLAAVDAARAPHAFSGGQRQRIAIARALVAEPEVVVLDEPLSALDVTVQRQILGLLNDLKARHRLAYLFITHDLGVAKAIADRVAVMHRGRIVESGTTAAVFDAPRDRYTARLLAAVPVFGSGRRTAEGAAGGVP